jgi:hypothetical protein
MRLPIAVRRPVGSRRAVRPVVAAALIVCAAPLAARADALSAAEILDRPRPYHLESVRVRFTHFDQDGYGYQSQAGPVLGPGSEAAAIEEPQAEVVVSQGARITHRIWVPVDVVTSASPDSIDVISTASRTNPAGSLDFTTSYRYSQSTDLHVRAGVHVEAPFRSFNMGLGWTRRLADDNAVISASVNQVVDWFDGFDIHGVRLARVGRSTSNANVGLTQLLSPTTVAHVNYGFTLQAGELSNTWNSLPLTTGGRGQEILPQTRHRHAFVGRLVQGLPWNGVLKAFYRYYVDGWGLSAHTLELQLYQRILPWLYVRGDYRVHFQRGVDFFTTLADPEPRVRTADSDLASFFAQTFGGKVAFELARVGRLRELTADVAYERYLRSDGLSANVYSCAIGFRF